MNIESYLRLIIVARHLREYFLWLITTEKVPRLSYETLMNACFWYDSARVKCTLYRLKLSSTNSIITSKVRCLSLVDKCVMKGQYSKLSLKRIYCYYNVQTSPLSQMTMWNTWSGFLVVTEWYNIFVVWSRIFREWNQYLHM